MGKSNIGWTGETLPLTTGCAPTSEGCGAPLGPGNCYAAVLTSTRLATHPRYEGLASDGQFNGQVRLHWDRLHAPFRWRRPRMVFVCSMSDLFYDRVPVEFIAAAWAMMALNPQHTFQVLTKRHGRLANLTNAPQFRADVAKYAADLSSQYGRLTSGTGGGVYEWPPPNIWGGVSVEDQKAADRRIPALMRAQLAVRFLSCEPLLGPVDLSSWLGDPTFNPAYRVARCGQQSAHPRHVMEHGPDQPRNCPGTGAGIDWVIAGGQSGPGHQVMDLTWLTSLADECTQAQVPLFVKQDSGPTAGKQGRIPDELWQRKEFPRVVAHVG